MKRKGVRRLERGCTWNPRTGVAHFCVYLKRSQKKKQLTFVSDNEQKVRDRFHAFRRLWKRTETNGKIPTLRAFYDGYFKTITAGLRPATIRGYRHALEGRLLPEFGQMRLDQITSGTVIMYGKRLLEEGLSPATINAYVNTLKAIVSKAVDWEILDESPFRRPIRALKTTLPKNELSDEERERFLAAFDDRAAFDDYLKSVMPRGAAREKVGRTRGARSFGGKRRIGAGIRPGSEAAAEYFVRYRWLKPYFLCLFTTGLRREDARLLRWSEVNLQTNTIELTTRKKEVDVVLPIARALRQELLACRKRPLISEFVFTDEEGQPFCIKRIQRCFAIAKTIARIAHPFRIHDARHTLASLLVSSGASLTTTARMLGHSDVRSTLRYARADKVAAAEEARGIVDAKFSF